jgi:exodeoxyribonuclease VII large subunit
MTRRGPDPDDAQLTLEARFARPPVAARTATAPLGPIAEAGSGDDSGADADPRPSAPATAPAATAIPVAPAAVGPPAPRIYAVGELLRAVRLTLESRFAEVRVEGEISGLKRSGPGHLYFCLKDEEGQLECVLFSREAARLKFTPEEGMAVRCRGRLTLYESRGRFQMSVVDIEPTGAGALALAFEQLKQRLGAEGLFAAERKRPLPFLPRRIGVVTSQQGAVIRDIIRVAHRRFPAAILVAATPVQGEGAALSIAAAIRRLEAVSDVDVIIVARGGGSLEDLWAFNEEPVIRAIVACRVPVVSAVGHETDFTIADFVADLRAATPSAAAERVVPMLDDLRAELALCRRRAGRALGENLRAARHGLERARSGVGDPRRLIDQRRQSIDESAERARRVLTRRLAAMQAELRMAETRLHRAHPQRRILEQRGALAAMRHRLEVVVRPAIAARRHAIVAAAGKLDALSPVRVLERGFSLTERADGHVITSVEEVGAGDQVRVRLRDGALAALVKEIRRK